MSVYDGETLSTETIRAVRGCDDLTDGPTSVFFVMEGTEPEASPMCYELDAVDATSLAYVYSARGNRLAYDRVAE